uniref:Zinc finger protein 254-like n=1 Tax=Diabrotica virgifera virgifera TaxID=50390 RepID=A0A6P7FB81_DIAVI
MEVKQEVSDETSQAKIYCSVVDDGALDICKIEIKKETLEESTQDRFDYVGLKQIPIKTEIEEQGEYKLMSFKEMQTNTMGFPQEENTLDSMKTIPVPTGYKEEHTSHPVEENTLKCEICVKQFAHKKSLNKHMKIHNEQKPYKCEICFKRFSWPSALKQHMILHTGEKPYTCD